MPDDLTRDEQRLIRKAIRAVAAKAREEGRAEGRREAATLLEYAARLNGSTPHAVAVLKGWDESKHKRDHGKFSSTGGVADSDSPGDGPQSPTNPDPGDLSQPFDGDRVGVSHEWVRHSAAWKEHVAAHYGDWGKKVPAEQREAVEEYEKAPWVNAFVRSGALPGERDRESLKWLTGRASRTAGDAAKMVSHMDAAIASAPPTDRPTVLHRWVSADDDGPARDLYDALDRGDVGPGGVLTDSAYQSTSYGASIVPAGRSRREIILRINAPAGTRALPTEAIGVGSQGEDQREMILPRGAKYTVKGVSRKGGTLVVDVDYQLPDGPPVPIAAPRRGILGRLFGKAMPPGGEISLDAIGFGRVPAGGPGSTNTERAPDPAGVRKAAVHAPKGGASVGGKKYRGGEFVPGEVVAAATPDEKRELGVAGVGGEKEKPTRKKPASTPAAKSPRTKPDPPPERFNKDAGGRNLVDANVQRWCEGSNEPAVAAVVKGKALPDNEPMDIRVPPEPDPARHGIELKTMVFNGHGQIHMSGEAKRRKRAWRRKHGVPVHTVVIDDRDVYNAKGPGKHDTSKRRVYYRRGFGSFKVAGMHEVEGGLAGLPALLETPTRKLPPGAWRPKKTGGEIRKREAATEPAGANPEPPGANTPGADRAPHPVAAKWVESGGSHLPEPLRAKYAADLSAALSGMPGPARQMAIEAVEKGGPRFHADVAAVTAEANRLSGRREKAVHGFVRHRPGGAVELHLDGGSDTDPKAAYAARGTYAHELWHAVDSDGYYSNKAGWHSAYKRDVLKGRTLLSRYAMTDPSEGFAELGRALHERGEDYVREKFPACHKFLASEKLL